MNDLDEDIPDELQADEALRADLTDVEILDDPSQMEPIFDVIETASRVRLTENDTVNLVIQPAGEPQERGVKFYVHETTTDARFLAGYTVRYEGGKGLSQDSRLREIPPLKYNRFGAEQTIGLWAHFMWPTVCGESGEFHARVNSYDRAAFTFGFYQLAAHLAGENLILLFRELLKLPLAKLYYPDLTLQSGKVARVTAHGPVTLERVERVTRPNGNVENQLPDFMAYLDPGLARLNAAEVLNSAKLMHWIWFDPAMLEASLRVAFSIMHDKISRRAASYNLIGKPPELAIWVSDILHQGRGSKPKILAALGQPNLNAQLSALFEIDNTKSARKPEGWHLFRRETVRDRVKKLRDEGRFNGVSFGSGPLALAPQA